MKRPLLFKAFLIAASITAGAQVNSQAYDGFLARSQAMLSVGNFNGCIDQLSSLDYDNLTPEQRRQADWLSCSAAYKGGFNSAKALLQSYIDTYPTAHNRAEATLLLGNCLLEESVAEAYKIYQTIDESLFDVDLAANLNYHTAYSQMCLGEYDLAEKRFYSLVDNDEYGEASKFYVGYIAYIKKDYATAKKYLIPVDRSSEPGASADYYLAQIYYMEGDEDLALQHAQQLLMRPTIDPLFNDEINRIAGEILFKKGQTKRAIAHLENYVEAVDEPRHSALYILGTNAYNNGNYDKAIEYLEPVTTEKSAMAQSAYLYIGESLMRRGEKDAAIMAFDNAIRMEYDAKVQEAAFYNYAVAKFGGANIPFGSSVATFEEFLYRYPNGTYAPRVQEYLIAGYLTDSNYETALESINRMANPTEKVLAAKQQILYALGTRSLTTNNPKQAKAFLLEAVKLDKYSPEVAFRVQHSLGEAYYAIGDYNSAIIALNNYLGKAPATDINRPLALYDLGYAQFAKKDYKSSAITFSKIVDSKTNLNLTTVCDALNRLADSYFYLEDFDTAYKYYSRAYDNLPQAGDYPLFQQGVIQGYNRKYEDKIATLDKLLTQFPTSTLVPDAMLEMTEGYLQLGRNDDAIETYRRLVENHPGTEQGRRGYLQLALTLLNTGDRAGAIDSYKQVISRYPTSEEATMALEELQRIAAEDGTLGDIATFLADIENAPQLDVAESDRLTFEAAEQAFIAKQSTERMESYLTEYPNGAYRSSALGYMMEAAWTAGNMPDALAYATTIVEKYPDTRMAEMALMVKAQAEHSLGQGDEALQTWTLLESRASEPAIINTARVGIMRIARDLADYDRLIKVTDALLASSTIGIEDRYEVIFSHALALSMTDNLELARSEWAQIAEYTDDIYGVKSAYYLAESYFNSKDFDKAQEHTEMIIGSATPHTYWLARAFILLSDVYAAQGKDFEAREYLRSLKDNYPGNESDIFQMIDSRLNELQ